MGAAAPIGVFDSGVGGLTVVRELERLLPGRPIIYFGDTARTPYGPKSPETLVRYAVEDTEFLLSRGAGVVVVACNSASSVAVPELRRRFSVPVFEVITPAVELALEVTRRGVVGVIGTRATVSSGVYERQLRARAPGVRVHSRPCPLLVPLVEEGWLRTRETRMIVKKYLHPLKVRQVDTLILGCTHYPLLKEVIQAKIGRRVRVIDSSTVVARRVRDALAEGPETASTGGPRSRFFVSDLTPNTVQVVRRFLGRRVELEKVSVPG
ncbi:glutamate racemase [Dissulfurirhabdus thermomarina]|uniref:Glutamate racemase n=1 Tax=Dissulfurirhabdus thermomarina TaxID=1765737 RepID=A0A6N9TN61_DISTH|nr:glutamate racemase [Dissulfurirhabdus thermomarina]NDY42731.1 glutamate racemase [Dissulfurirhabdus thermomarina]NMX22562.1 glutamate racemase [Dissulfurirhabdus thermomarina]